MPLHFILSQKDSKLLLHNRFFFNKLRVCGKDQHIKWRCVEYSNSRIKCGCIANTSSQEKTGVLLFVGDHNNHLVDAVQVNVRKVINKIKKNAKTGRTIPSLIVTEAVAHSSRSAGLPDNSLLSKTVRRTRQKRNHQLHTTASREVMEISEHFQRTIDGKPFLFHGSQGKKNRFLIFTTDDDLKRLANCRIWLADGTFSTVRTVFKQLYTIHGILESENHDTRKPEYKTVPFIYIVTPKKDEKTCTKIVRELIKANNIEFKPEKLVVDFELAFINSVEKIMLDVDLHGCFFHYSQCVQRKIKLHGFQMRYNKEDEFALHIKLVIALPFVPPEKVRQTYQSLLTIDFF